MRQGFFGVEQQGIVLGEISADIKNFSFWDGHLGIFLRNVKFPLFQHEMTLG